MSYMSCYLYSQWAIWAVTCTVKGLKKLASVWDKIKEIGVGLYSLERQTWLKHSRLWLVKSISTPVLSSGWQMSPQVYEDIHWSCFKPRCLTTVWQNFFSTASAYERVEQTVTSGHWSDVSQRFEEQTGSLLEIQLKRSSSWSSTRSKLNCTIAVRLHAS